MVRVPFPPRLPPQGSGTRPPRRGCGGSEGRDPAAPPWSRSSTFMLLKPISQEAPPGSPSAGCLRALCRGMRAPSPGTRLCSCTVPVQKDVFRTPRCLKPSCRGSPEPSSPLGGLPWVQRRSGSTVILGDGVGAVCRLLGPRGGAGAGAMGSFWGGQRAHGG